MRSTFLLAAASLALFSNQAPAATTHAAAATTRTTAVARPAAVAKPVAAAKAAPAAKPSAKPGLGSMMARLTPHRGPAAPAAPAARVATAARHGARLVTTKTKTGKTVTYNCGLAGNATKAVCKS